jgi:membrane associated rhomboid family serine protease
MWQRWLNGNFVVLGRRVPVVIGGLIGLTLLASIVGAITHRAGLPLVQAGALVPALVLQGQVWRLVTWVFFEMHPLLLIIAGLMLWWFGKDLCYGWGAHRFLGLYLGIATASGLVTTLVTWLVLPPEVLAKYAYVGSWPVVDAVIIAWALTFPHRKILLYLLVPVGGETLIYMIVGGTVLFAIFGGFALYIPHFAALGLILVYLKGVPIRRLWLRLQLAYLERRHRQDMRRLRIVTRQDNDKDRWTH